LLDRQGGGQSVVGVMIGLYQVVMEHTEIRFCLGHDLGWIPQLSLQWVSQEIKGFQEQLSEVLGLRNRRDYSVLSPMYETT